MSREPRQKITCDHPGCTSAVIGLTARLARLAAVWLGWRCGMAWGKWTDLCPAHTGEDE